MSSATIVHDPSEAVPLCPALGLYLKPIARVTISVSLPPPPPAPSPSPSSTSPPPRAPSRAVSNWEVMEGLRAMAQGARAPLSSLRLARGGPEVVRFEGEVENRALVRPALAGLDGKTMMLSGLTHGLRVRAAEATPPPTDDPAHPHDTIHLQGLPCRWFAPRGGSGGDEAGGISSPSGVASAERPSEALLRQAFGAFGEIRHVDIPMLDPYLGEDGSHGGGGRLRFEAYVQYRERDAYARAMAALRGAKLMFRGTDGKAVACGIKVTSDATQHLSEASIRRRQLERQKLQELEQRREEQKRKEREDEARRRAGQRKQREAEQQQRARRREEKLRRREARARARRRRGRRREEEEVEPQPGLGHQEEGAGPRRLLLAQRNLQSVRLVAALLARAEAARRRQREQSEERRRHAKEAELRRQQEAELRRQREAELRRVEEEKRRALGLQRRERELRHRLLALLLARGPGLGRLVGGAGAGSDVVEAGNSKMTTGGGQGEAGHSQTVTGSEVKGNGSETMKTGSGVATSGNGHVVRENEKMMTGSGIPTRESGTGDSRGADKQTGSGVPPTGSDDAKTGNGASGTGGGSVTNTIAKVWTENVVATTGSGSTETGSGIPVISVAKMTAASANDETGSSSTKLKAMPTSCSDREKSGLESRPSWHTRDIGGSSGRSRSREGSERRRPHEEEDGGGRDRKRGHRHREDRGRSRSRSPRRR